MIKYKNALLIIEGSYLSSVVSAHTSTNGKVSTSASYNYKSALELIANKCDIETFTAVTFCDALPFDDKSEIAYEKISRVKKFHNYLRKINVKVRLGKTERDQNQVYRQTGVNIQIVDTLCFYHDRYDENIPIVIVSADGHLFSCIKRLIHEGRKIILIGSDNPEKNLYYKSGLKNLATKFVNLTTEDILQFKNKPGFSKEESQS